MKFTLAVLALAVLAASLPAQTTDNGQRPYPTYPTGRPRTTYSYREAQTIYIENHSSQASFDVALDELKHWGHFKIVGEPSDADLIFELMDAHLVVSSRRWGSNANCLYSGRDGVQGNYFGETSLSEPMGKNSGGVKGMVEDFIRSWEMESATEDQMLKRRALPLNVLLAKKVFIDNQTEKAALTEAASDEFKEWGFFDVVHDRDNADLIFALDYHGQFIGDLSWADDICAIVRLVARESEGVRGLIAKLRERVEGTNSLRYRVVPVPSAHPPSHAVDSTD